MKKWLLKLTFGVLESLGINLSQKNTDTALEVLLRKASEDPSFREEFYQKLLSEALIVLSNPMSSQNLEQPGTAILTFEDGRIPIFTSQSRVFDKGVIQHQVQAIVHTGRTFFQNFEGATFILNPFSDYVKELVPQEIALLLKASLTWDYSALNDSYQKIEWPADTLVGICQPAVYPTEIVNALCKLFMDDLFFSVKAAYMGCVSSPSTKPHLLFALDVEGDVDRVIKKAIFTAQQVGKSDEVIDFIQIGSESNTFIDYLLNETKPFYIRQH